MGAGGDAAVFDENAKAGDPNAVERKERFLSAEDIKDLQFLALDLSQMMHAVKSSHIADSCISVVKTALGIFSTIISRVKDLQARVPSLQGLILCAERTVNPLKWAHGERRQLAVKKTQELNAKLLKISTLLASGKNMWDDDMVLETRAAHTLFKVSVDFDPIVDRILVLLFEHFHDDPNVIVVMVPQEVESAQVMLHREFGVHIVSIDRDLVLHGAEQILLEIKLTSVDVRIQVLDCVRMFAEDFVSAHESKVLRNVGAFRKFKYWDRLPLIVMFVIKGGDWFTLDGSTAGVRDMGPASAYSFVNKLIENEDPTASSEYIFDKITQGLFTDNHWTKVFENTPAGRALNVNKQLEFKRAVAYVHYALVPAISIPEGVLFFSALKNRSAMISLTNLNAGALTFRRKPGWLSSCGALNASSGYDADDFYGTRFLASQQSTVNLVRNNCFHSYSDTTFPLAGPTCILAKSSHLEELAACYSLSVSIDEPNQRTAAITLINSRVTAGLRFRPLASHLAKRVESRVVLGAKIGQGLSLVPLLSPNNVESPLSYFQQRDPRNRLHAAFRLDVNDAMLTDNDVRRRIRLVFGYCLLENISAYFSHSGEYVVWKFADLFSSYRTEDVDKGYVATLAFARAYESATSITDVFMRDLCSCSCEAGNSTCAHIDAARLSLGLLLSLVETDGSEASVRAAWPQSLRARQSQVVAVSHAFPAPLRQAKLGVEPETSVSEEDATEFDFDEPPDAHPSRKFFNHDVLESIVLNVRGTKRPGYPVYVPSGASSAIFEHAHTLNAADFAIITGLLVPAVTEFITKMHVTALAPDDVEEEEQSAGEDENSE